MEFGGFGLAYIVIFGFIILIMVILTGYYVFRIISDSKSADIDKVDDDFIHDSGQKTDPNETRTRGGRARIDEDDTGMFDPDEVNIDDSLKD